MNTTYLSIEEFESKFNQVLLNDDFEKLLYDAQRKINRVTYNRIVGNYERLTAFQKEKIKMAVGYQIIYLMENGVEEDKSEAISYSVLDISVNTDHVNETIADKLHMSNKAYEEIKQTGLCSLNFRWH